MKSSLELPESPEDTAPVAPTDIAQPSRLRTWWRSRTARWVLIVLVLAGALAIALEPLIRDQVKVVMGNLCAARAQSEFLDGDLPAALGELDKAVAWSPDNPMILLFRAGMRKRNDDMQGSLADYDRVIKLSPTFSGGYAGRAQVYQRLGRYDDAVSDLTIALQNQPAWEPEPWNHRAYVRALGGVDLPAALDDVNEAIRLSPDENANYLDTRGLIAHKMGNQQAALDDLNRAIQLTIAQREQWRLQAEKEQSDPRIGKLRREEFDHTLAVMHEHRGLIQGALGHEAEAQQDRDEARKLGYDPAHGIE